MKITVQDLDRWGACDRGDGERYNDENLQEYFKGRDSITDRKFDSSGLVSCGVGTGPGVGG